MDLAKTMENSVVIAVDEAKINVITVPVQEMDDFLNRILLLLKCRSEIWSVYLKKQHPIDLKATVPRGLI